MSKEKKPEDSKKLDPSKNSKPVDKKQADRELSEEELKDVSGGAKTKKTKFPYVYR